MATNSCAIEASADLLPALATSDTDLNLVCCADKLHSNYDSPVANHLAGNEHCRLRYCDDDFSVLARARSKLHLCVLEALYNRHFSPDLCAQKNFVLALSLFSPNSSPSSSVLCMVYSRHRPDLRN